MKAPNTRGDTLPTSEDRFPVSTTRGAESPVAAFQRLIELVRTGSPLFEQDPDAIFGLLRPFLVNPNRNEEHVRMLMRVWRATWLSRVVRDVPLLKQTWWLFKWVSADKTTEEAMPDLMKRLRVLEASLLEHLRPGTITLHLRPARYLGTPAGFGAEGFNKYRIQMQTLVEPTREDVLQAVTVEFQARSSDGDVTVDDMSPQAAFSVVAVRSSAGLQVGEQQSRSDKQAFASELSGGGVKMSAGNESTHTEQLSTVVTVGGERTISRVEQFMIARRIGHRAVWRALAGVGAVDAAGSEYTADILVPRSSKQIDVHIEARAEWLNSGVVPVELTRCLSLPEAVEETRQSPHQVAL